VRVVYQKTSIRDDVRIEKREGNGGGAKVRDCREIQRANQYINGNTGVKVKYSFKKINKRVSLRLDLLLFIRNF